MYLVDGFVTGFFFEAKGEKPESFLCFRFRNLQLFRPIYEKYMQIQVKTDKIPGIHKLNPPHMPTQYSQ
jgi:hypothetical protein